MCKKIIILIVLLIGLVLLNGCGDKITKEEYNEIIAELEV